MQNQRQPCAAACNKVVGRNKADYGKGHERRSAENVQILQGLNVFLVFHGLGWRCFLSAKRQCCTVACWLVLCV